MIKTIYHPKTKQICTKITSNTQKKFTKHGANSNISTFLNWLKMQTIAITDKH